MSRHARRLRRHGASGKPDVIVGVPPRGDKPMLLTHATLQDLIPYMEEIRGAYWHGVKEGRIANPLVLIVHRMSDLAKARGLDQHPTPLVFHAISRQDAVRDGFYSPELADATPARPPVFEILLATGSEVQVHIALNTTHTAIIDMIRSDPSCRPKLEADNPGLAAELDRHPEWFAGY